MIKELLLSLAVAAFSGVSSFVGSPKRQNQQDTISFSVHFYSDSFSCYGETTSGIQTSFDLGNEDSARIDLGALGSDINVTFQGEDLGTSDSYFDLDFDGFDSRPDVSFVSEDFSLTYYDGEDGYAFYFHCQGEYAYDFWNGLAQTDVHLDFTISEYIEPEYTITKELYNCSINSTPELPQTYTTQQVGQTFVIYGAANSDLAGDYGFNSSSLSVTGASATALSLTNEIGNTGYYRGCSFSVTLPANSFTITLRAYRPEFSIVSTLNNCTVSPAIQSSYSGMFAEDFTFTAEQGFYFNKNVTQWEFTGGVVAQEPEYIGLVWGTLYESVKIRLVFDAGNATIRVSGVAYTIDSYQQGWKDGDKAGYDRGHADGLVAGDSYGVWNWLKQAARTTGEFLSIPLLPGFSIGGLLTALAGLVIIWFFIKGFLFKS